MGRVYRKILASTLSAIILGVGPGRHAEAGKGFPHPTPQSPAYGGEYSSGAAIPGTSGAGMIGAGPAGMAGLGTAGAAGALGQSPQSPDGLPPLPGTIGAAGPAQTPQGPSVSPPTAPTTPSAGMAPTAPGAGTTPTAPGAAGAPPSATGAGDAASMLAPQPGAGEGFTMPEAPAAGLGGNVSQAGGYFPNVIGDQPPFFQHPTFRIRQANGIPSVPPIPTPGRPPVPPAPGQLARRGQALYPTVRGFKIADNQSPRPMDRIYFTFNFFDALNTSINRSLGIPLYNIKAYREVFGLEKTFLNKRASIQARFPLTQLTAQSPFVNYGFGGSNSSAGDLAVILKYALYDNRDTGRLFSTGLLINTPTGPTNFAGANYLRSVHTTTLQPFIGYILPFGRFFVQGFSAIDVPMTDRDVTILYNDVAFGYLLYQAERPDSLLRSFVPSFEVHVNTPLNHQNYLDPNDPVGTPNVVDLTFGGNFFLGERSLLTLGLVEPVTGPRPFNYEFILQFNLWF